MTLCDCPEKNPLVRDGVSRNQRRCPSLDSGYVSVDERTLKDLLAYLHDYAGLIKYWPLHSRDRTDQDWVVFIEKDFTTFIALFSRFQTREINEQYLELIKAVEATESSPAIQFRSLFRLIYEMARCIDLLYSNMPESTAASESLSLLIQTRLKGSLSRMVAWGKGSPMSVPVECSLSDLHPVWGEIPDGVAMDRSIYKGATIPQKLRSAIAAISPVYEVFYQTCGTIQQDLDGYLQDACENYPAHPPHFALLLAFLQLFQVAQKHINTLGRRHLSFYYKDVLGLNPRSAVPDQVHVVFELAKNTKPYQVSKGTQLKAGKDAKGNALTYKTVKDLVVNPASVAQIKTLFVDTSQKSRIYAAPVANSSDGQGKALTGTEPSWMTFGEKQSGKSADTRTMIDGDAGWALASPILLLKEGKRTVTLTLTFKKELAGLAGADLNEAFCAWFSGEKTWLEPTKKWGEETGGKATLTSNNVIELVFTLEQDKPAVAAYDKSKLKDSFPSTWPVMKVLLNTKKKGTYLYGQLKGAVLASVKIGVTVKGVQDLVLQNDASVLKPGKPFTPFGVRPIPGSRFLVGSHEAFSKKVTNLSLNIDWMDVPVSFSDHYAEYDVTVTNTSFKGDLSLLNKGDWGDPLVLNQILFYPSSQVDRLRPLLKRAKELIAFLQAQCSGTGSPMFVRPGSTKVYTGPAIDASNIDAYVADVAALVDDSLMKSRFSQAMTGFKQLFYAALGSLPDALGKVARKRISDWSGETTRITGSEPAEAVKDLKARILAVAKKLLEKDSSVQQTITATPANFDRDADLESFTAYNPSLFRGFVRLDLSQPVFAFGHALYSHTMIGKTLDLVKWRMDHALPASGEDEDDEDKPKLPNEPYTPMIRTITLDYDSDVTLDLETEVKEASGFKKRVDRFYHIEPFGLAERHRYYDKQVTLLPDFGFHGALYIGIEDFTSPANLSLLFKMAEGSASPDYDPPKIHWQVLVNDRWVTLEKSRVVSDSTNGFLTTGIVELSIPTGADSDGTLLPSGYHWVRALAAANSDCVCRMMQIHAQAVAARFVDNGNDPDHLKTPLKAKSISRQVNRVSQIKSVSQPYASFGGKLKEAGQEFNQRISERLRHKERAVTVWDYERIVLNRFSSLYKVKCLNHTDDESEMAPGSVTLIPIPDLQNKNAVDKLKPRTDQNTLTAIGKYLEKRISPWVELLVENPQYEEIVVKCNVKFKTGLDEGYHLTRLKADLTRYLSPWAFEKGQDIVFGGEVHGSTLINFIEECDYVDYITDFRLEHVYKNGKKEDVTNVSATGAKSILVSSEKHEIEIIEEKQ